MLPQLGLEARLLEWMVNFGEAKRCAVLAHSIFLRYYRADMEGNHFKLHMDDGQYTVVCCFPPWDLCDGEAPCMG